MSRRPTGNKLEFDFAAARFMTVVFILADPFSVFWHRKHFCNQTSTNIAKGGWNLNSGDALSRRPSILSLKYYVNLDPTVILTWLIMPPFNPFASIAVQLQAVPPFNNTNNQGCCYSCWQRIPSSQHHILISSHHKSQRKTSFGLEAVLLPPSIHLPRLHIVP